jgi:hypothetical protein
MKLLSQLYCDGLMAACSGSNTVGGIYARGFAYGSYGIPLAGFDEGAAAASRSSSSSTSIFI